MLERAGHGANVIVNARSDKAEADAVGKERMRTSAEETFGGVDIYVSSAARRLYKDFFTITDQDWHYYLNQQLTASWYLAKAFVPGMRDRGWGRVVHINGEDGWTRVPHSVGEGGLRTLTKSLARGWASTASPSTTSLPASLRPSATWIPTPR